MSFSVTAKAENTRFADPPDPDNSTAILDWLAAQGGPNGPATNGTISVGGTFRIDGTYCRPVSLKAINVLQLLVHGATYDKSYWSGFGVSAKYDWPLFAAQRGYSTLAIDRLGHGANLQHPDAVEWLQMPLHIEIVHEIISSIQQGNSPLGHRFESIVYIGHSYGSGMGTAIASAHGKDLDALILTAHSARPFPAATQPLDADLASARDAMPRFHSLPPGYLTLRHEEVREHAFYAGAYDPSVSQHDFTVEDTVTPGELLVQSAGFTPATGFTAPVMVVTGEKDQILCNPAMGVCNDILNATRSLFPDSKAYNFYVVPDTGHDIVLHYSALKTFAVVHDWLDGIFDSRGKS